MKTPTLFTPNTAAWAGLCAAADTDILPDPGHRHRSSCRAGPGMPVQRSLRTIAGGVLLLIALAMGGLGVSGVQAQEAPGDKMPVVNINTADVEELSSVLQGVGRARAEAIVQYREMYGPFESIEELMDVSGVGEATLARNRQAITLE